MVKFLVRWFVGACVRDAQRSFGGSGGVFNTAGFQQAVERRCGLFPTGKVAAYLLCQYGCDQLHGGCHWLYPGSAKVGPKEESKGASKRFGCMYCGREIYTYPCIGCGEDIPRPRMDW